MLLALGVISEALPSTIKMVLSQDVRFLDLKRAGYHSFVNDFLGLEE